MKLAIEQTFSNSEIFDIFKYDKIIILFMIEHKIITIDKNIFLIVVNNKKLMQFQYIPFFFLESAESVSHHLLFL